MTILETASHPQSLVLSAEQGKILKESFMDCEGF